ncbi:MAG: ammonium transporter [Candidatus Omnitrophica bacterium]|nr:ammonium transporter [Candidatus Omnitrophota bacterium]MCM8802111.1 ammonium transporter [Candidatus Omnitrophota bacterium]
MDITTIVNTIWVLVTAKLVFFMNLGFAMVESGFTRTKNTTNILSKNFIVFAVTSLAFLFVGWGLMFGDGNGFIGFKGLFLLQGPDNSPSIGDNYKGVYSALSWVKVPLYAKFFFQLAFCGTAATIVSGAVAERIKYTSFIIFSFLMCMFIYPIVGHWVWGGGWLSKLGMLDFAGSTVVHSVGGWAALAGVLLLGPRFGKYENGKTNIIPGHSLPLATIGTFVLWFGWFGFNPGSTMTADPIAISHIVVTTNTSATTAMISSTIISYILLGKPDLGMTLNGCLAGLVAITAPCAFVTVAASMIIGFIAGILVVLSVIFFDKIKIDDPVGALSVHLVNGIFGTLSVGLFAKNGICGITCSDGLLYKGGIKLLLTQIVGIISVGIFVFITSLIFWILIKKTIGIRVSLKEEIEGLDIGEHGNISYPEFYIKKTYF